MSATFLERGLFFYLDCALLLQVPTRATVHPWWGRCSFGLKSHTEYWQHDQSTLPSVTIHCGITESECLPSACATQELQCFGMAFAYQRNHASSSSTLNCSLCSCLRQPSQCYDKIQGIKLKLNSRFRPVQAPKFRFATILHRRGQIGGRWKLQTSAYDWHARIANSWGPIGSRHPLHHTL